MAEHPVVRTDQDMYQILRDEQGESGGNLSLASLVRHAVTEADRGDYGGDGE